MVRKIHIDSDNTIQQWIDSQNTMSDYMGDLDDFKYEIRTTELNQYGDIYLEKLADSGLYDTYRPGYRDSSFVTAVNHIYDPMVTFLTSLFNGGSAKFKANLLVDSATFRILRLDDSPGGTGNIFTHLYAADAHVRDSYERGDSIGSTGLINSYIPGDSTNYLIPNFKFDFFVESGATFDNLVVRGTFDSSFALDSAIFNSLTIHDSGYIQTLTQDSLGFVKINFALVHNVDNTIDSAKFNHLLKVTNITSDSATIDSALINNLYLQEDLTFDDSTYDGVSKFLITDSRGPSSPSDPGVIQFGGYKLDVV
jgi:hypothetical protein